MRISAKDWAMYTARLSRLGKTAESMMREYIAEHGEEEIERLWDFAFGLVTKYGEGAASLACEMYDALAEAQGARVPPASPAYTARLWETEVAMKGTTDAEKPAAVSRLVKRSAADTTLKNAIRDHAEFAWIPSGDSCAFCLTLASRGWQPASKNSLKNGHAEHIHANCDCQYAIRFDQNSTVQGYDPEKYRKMYDAAEGATPQEKINSMRREMAAEKREDKTKFLSSEKQSDILITKRGTNTKLNASGEVINPMAEEDYYRIKDSLENHGIEVFAATEGDDFRYLLSIGAEGTYSNGRITHVGRIPSRGTLFEEILHMNQAQRYGELLESDFVELCVREVEANRMLLERKDFYKLDDIDVADIKRNLAQWEHNFMRLTGESYDESNYR